MADGTKSVQHNKIKVNLFLGLYGVRSESLSLKSFLTKQRMIITKQIMC